MSAYHLTGKSKKSLINFLNELNLLLRKYEMDINFIDGAIFSNSNGYLGQLEDNKDYVSISDGQEDIFVSEKTPKEF